MEIIHHETPQGGRFVASEDGMGTGFLSYIRRDDSTFIIDHTEVRPEFRGRDIARQLVLEAAAYARANSLRIRPRCPYARRVFERTPEIQDLLA